MTDRIFSSDYFRAFLVAIGAVCQMAFAFMPELLGWSNSISSRSDATRTMLIPAGYAFVIWLYLYFGAIAFAIYHALPRQLRDPRMRRVGWLAAAAFWSNAVWALYTPNLGPDWISFILLEAILAPLLAMIAFTRSGVGDGLGRQAALVPIYSLAGWLTVASPVGFSLTLAFTGWITPNPSDPSPELVILGVGGALAAAFCYYARSFAYALPVSWGAIAIYVANSARGQDALAWTAAALAGLAIVATIAGKRPAIPGLVPQTPRFE